MGYYTFHTLHVKNVRPEEEEKLVEAMDNLDIIGYALEGSIYRYDDDEIGFGGEDEVKWYSHDEDMMKLSKLFPRMIFKLHGEGEESGDIWDSYYQNGVVETCQAEVIVPKPTKIPWD